jgi:hypothetical protein
MGWDCLWGTVKQSDNNLVTATMKVMNLWILGFFLHADCGGIKFWNISMVWIVCLVQWLISKPAFDELLSEACPAELQQIHTAMMVTEIWAFLALGCAWMDSRNSSGAAAEEPRPLNVQTSPCQNNLLSHDGMSGKLRQECSLAADAASRETKFVRLPSTLLHHDIQIRCVTTFIFDSFVAQQQSAKLNGPRMQQHAAPCHVAR